MKLISTVFDKNFQYLKLF